MRIIAITFLLIAIGLGGCSTRNTNPQSNRKLEPGTPAYEAESEQIMNTINEEFKAYFVKDYETWQSKFIHQDYFRYWGYWDGYPEKIRQYNSWEELDTDKRKRMAGETKAYWDDNNVGMDIRDLNLQIRDEVAWVTFRQISRDQETGDFLGEALETKILEKENGEWKIVYLNFLYLPTDKENTEE
jgi:hypothetical protein